MKIVVTGGGTGGHVFPGLAVASALAGHQVVYAGSEHGFEKKMTARSGLPFHSVASRAAAGKSFSGKLSALPRTALGFFQALKFLRQFKPDVVVGTGGYVSFPVILASVVLRKPALLLEQNLLPGKTTRFFAGHVSGVLASFEETKKYLPSAPVTVTGNPVRPEIGALSKETACRRLAFSARLPLIVLMGASQGARSMNQALLQALPRLQNKPWQILHLTGESHYDAVLKESKTKLPAKPVLIYHAVPFHDDMAAVYAAGDLMVSRAGGTTMAEIMVSRKPSLLIPYPYAAENHQEINARWLEARGGCLVIPDRELSGENLVSHLEKFMENPRALEAMGKRAGEAARPHALAAVLDAIRSAAKGRI